MLRDEYDVLFADFGHSGQSQRISQLLRRYYNTEMCAQTRMYFLFPNSHILMGRL